MKTRLVQSRVLKFRQVLLGICILKEAQSHYVEWNDLAVNKPSLVVVCSLSLMKVVIKTLLLFENGHPMWYKMLVKAKEVVHSKRITLSIKTG